MTQPVRRRAKRALGASTLACLAFAASGCVNISGQSEDQVDIIGSVEIVTEHCTDNDTNACVPPQASGSYELLLGYRIPATSDAPETIAATGTKDGTYTRNQQFTDELQRKTPAGEGRKWVGYVSETRTPTGGTPDAWSTRARFTLPEAPAGEVDPGTFASRTQVGYRSVGGSYAAARPVNCDEGNPSTTFGLPPNQITFMNRDLGTDCNDDAQDGEVLTRDLEVRGGVPVAVAPSATATVPFETELGGPGLDENQKFKLAGSSELGTVTLDKQEIKPSEDETIPVKATVTVPAGTAPGDYPVTLTATAEVGERGIARAAQATSGESRTATAVVRVVAPEQQQQQQPATVVVAPVPQQQAAPSLVAKACASRRSFPIRVRERRGQRLASARVLVNGKRVRVVRGARLRAAVVLTGLPKGTFTVKIVARTTSGKTLTGSRRYRTCIGKRPSGVPDL